MPEQAENPIQNKAMNEQDTDKEQKEQGFENSGEPEISQVQFEDFDQKDRPPSNRDRIDLIMDIVLPVSIELGRTKMYIKDILELERGSIIELDKMAGEPVDLYINNKKMAEGEVVVVDKHFGIRITNLIDPQDRIKNLGKDA